MGYILAHPLTPSEADHVAAVRAAWPGPTCCRDAYIPPLRVPRDQRIGAIRARNGLLIVRVVCPHCGRWKSGDLPLFRLRVPAAEVPIVLDRLTDGCQVKGCESVGIEVHHWATRAEFGFDADDWPTGTLCRAHHLEWHRRMNRRARNIYVLTPQSTAPFPMEFAN